LLIEHFTKHFSDKMRKPVKNIENSVPEILKNYDFSGNVRELKNMVERAVILSENGILKIKDFPFQKKKIVRSNLQPELKEENFDLVIAEKNLIKKALLRTGNNKTNAAKLLNISWYALDRKMKKHKI